MAKQAAIFGGMVGGKRGLFIRCMTIEAIFFRFLLIFYGIKLLVIFVMRQRGGGFLWCLQKKNENGGTDDDECQVEDNFFGGG